MKGNGWRFGLAVLLVLAGTLGGRSIASAASRGHVTKGSKAPVGRPENSSADIATLGVDNDRGDDEDHGANSGHHGACRREGRVCQGDGNCCAGLVCGDDSTCEPGCRIRGRSYQVGEVNPRNTCQTCQPGIDTRHWSSVADGTPCNDGSACTTEDTCRAGECKGGPPPACDDANICTVDSCDPAVGCVNAYVGDGHVCDMWVTDGAVLGSSLHDDTLYIAGDFNWVSPEAVGSFVPLDGRTGELAQKFPVVVGPILAAASDGERGWFIAGGFSQVGNVARQYLAHVLADGTVADWNPCEPQDDDQGVNNCAAPISSIAVGDGVVYVTGGDFYLRGEYRFGVAAFDADSGNVTPWNPDLAGSPGGFAFPTVLLLNGDTLFIGAGYGSDPGRVWAVDTATAEVSPGKATDLPVRALALRRGELYVGGTFNTIDGSARMGLAQVDVASWQVTPWDPGVVAAGPLADKVVGLAVAGDTLYVGGKFDAIGGRTRNGLAAVDTATGQVSDWDPNAWNPDNDLGITALAFRRDTVYVAGTLNRAPGSVDTLVAIDARTGDLLGWHPALHRAAPNLIVAARRAIWVGGAGFTFGGVERPGLAAIDVRTGRPTDWNPNADCFGSAPRSVGKIAATDDRIFIGLGSLAGAVEALDPSPGESNCLYWRANLDPHDAIDVMAVGGDTLYIGGRGGLATDVPGDVRSGIAAIDGSTGLVTPWDAGLLRATSNAAWVSAIEVVGDTVYVGGWFATAHGEPRNNLAAFDVVTGVATSWNPDTQPVSDAFQDIVRALDVSDGLVYVSGGFTSVGGQPRVGLAAVDTATGQVVSPWDPAQAAGALPLSVGDGVVYLGTGAVDSSTGGVLPWTPFHGPDFSPKSFEVRDGVVYCGGDVGQNYGLVGGQLRSGLAAVAGVSSAP